jgi:hypothetical protein
LFCKGVQHRLNHLSCIKMAALQLYLQLGKQKSRVGGGGQSWCFRSKISCWKRKCEMVLYHDATESSLAAKVRDKSSLIWRCLHKTSQQYVEFTFFWPSGMNHLWTISFMSNKILSMLSTMLFTCLAFFGLDKSSDLPCTAHPFLPESLSNHCQGPRCIFSYICTKLHAVPLSDPLRNHIRPDIQLQTKGGKKSASLRSCMKFCKLTPKIC